MKKKWILPSILFSQIVFALPCPFDAGKTCELKTDILKDKSPDGLYYYSPTNYDHRMSGEINVYDVSKVTKKADGTLTLLADIVNPGFWRTGEIMTRHNLTSPPYNSPTPSTPWTTKVTTHGYLEVNVRLPYCTASADGRCQNGSNPADYNRGLWPAIWMMPTYDNEWPLNGELDIMEAYPKDTAFNVTTAALHFNGNDPSCGGHDCRGWGYGLDSHTFPELAYKQPHTWGYEWEKDPQSTNGGYIMTGFIDNARVWGPLRTDTLPADGANAFRRAFNDPNGGLYLIVNLAIGGPYAGAPNPQIQKASMDVNSIKVYEVGGSTPPPDQCKPPMNITSSYTDDLRSVTLNWAKPQDGAAVQLFRVKDWRKNLIWEGTQLTFADKTLPGEPGKYTYFLTSVCGGQESTDVQYDVFITDSVCNPPRNITSTNTADKKTVTLKWSKPTSGATVASYEVKDWLKRQLWNGAPLTWTDKSLPGTSGRFIYFMNAVCQNGKRSALVQKDVYIP